jgi:hypothetical protein
LSVISKLKRVFRGDVDARTVAREAKRRLSVARERRRERSRLGTLNQQPARLRAEFARMLPPELLTHFQSRATPQFFPGFASPAETAELQRTLFPNETAQLVVQATKITDEHCWPLLGFGEKCFGTGEIDWNLDPLSGFDWPLTYHGDINLIRNDGSDARVVWELNRLAHFITLGRVYAINGDARYSIEFFHQLESWRAQNPIARGVNWNCAMEVALRAMNLVGAFALFIGAPEMNEAALAELLAMFDQHGAHIRRNLEFSHIATSNHYLADVSGLLWLGVMLPELEAAQDWREFGLGELLSEMDKQILPGGADYEASTGYHRLKVELFLYSFVLCHLNGIDIGEKYWSKLRRMLDYVRAYLRPDGRAPLIGDSDSGQVFPIVRRTGDDHAYILALGAAVFKESHFKISGSHAPEELLWILGEQGVRDYVSLPDAEPAQSQAFPDAGTYLLRDRDLYLLFNASGAGLNGRGSHGHNDALSIEVSAGGTAFIVDPGSYVYTADLHERHLFRSTAYHSTVQVDDVEQNSTEEGRPFVMSDEAQPRVLRWETSSDLDYVVAEHEGYHRLAQPVMHRRAIRFDKRERFWLVEDTLLGEGEHVFHFHFQFGEKLDTSIRADGIVAACDKIKGARLFVAALDANATVKLEPRFVSRDYGAKQPSVCACWTERASVPVVRRWALLPLCGDDEQAARLDLIAQLRDAKSPVNQVLVQSPTDSV